MHGILLCTSKALMTLWFAPKNSKQPYFVGNQLHVVSSRLTNIKPVDYMVRLPRKNTIMASHVYKKYYLLHNFSLLSEAGHLLLSDRITQEILNRASVLLELFYQQFQVMYWDGSCGLNVHNIRTHLVDFVRLWGPMWAWSCFSFEDINSMV